MIAAVHTEGQGFEVSEVSKPTIGPGDLLLRVMAASICGTDLRVVQNGQRKLAAGESVTLGHEFAGVIEEVGAGVEGYAPGMRVGVAPNIGCGRCATCAQGLPNMCPDYTAFGINIDGAHAEFVRIPAKAVTQGSVVELPASLEFARAALIEPLSCAISGIRSVNIAFGETVVIFGAGAIGLMHIQLARLCGATQVISVDLAPERLELASEVGADVCITTGKQDVQQEILALTGGAGADAILTACSVPAVQEQAMELLAPFGRVCFFGGLPKNNSRITLDSNSIHYKNLVVTGMTGGAPADFRAALKLLSAGRIDTSRLVSHTFAMSEMKQAYETALSGRCMKVVMAHTD